MAVGIVSRYARQACSFTFALLVTVVALPSSAPATDGTMESPHQVLRVDSDVTIDGRLDEPFWKDALVMGVNTEVRPGDNLVAPVKTDMLLAYTETHFLVAFRAEDPDPSRIVATLCDHDAMWDEEWVVIGIDPINSQRGTYEFACNPLGIQGDTAGGMYGDGNSWDGIWDSAGQINEDGYVVEMAIPFSTIRFQDVEGPQTWGVDAVRSWPRDVRYHISLYPRDRDNNCYYCQMKRIEGFEGASPGMNIEINPTVSAVRMEEREGFTSGDFEVADELYEGGLTARWGITPNVTLQAAVNPDFSQVEADAMQLDVNERFALYYEEKRPFFLEGSGMFTGVYTRTIADPRWGVKLSGRNGGSSYGLLSAEDEITNLIFPGPESSSSVSLDMNTYASALRYWRNVGDQSNLRFAINDREGDDYRNSAAGVAGELWFTESENVSFAYLHSTTDYPDDVAAAFGQPIDEFEGDLVNMRFTHSTRSWDWWSAFDYSTEDFRNDMNFTTRVDRQDYEAGLSYDWRADSDSWYTLFNVGSEYSYRGKSDGSPLVRGAIVWATYNGKLQSHANSDFWKGRESYLGEEFDTWALNGSAGFWPTGDLSVDAWWRTANDIDVSNVQQGKEFGTGLAVGYRAGRHLQLSLSHDYTHMHVPGGKLYTANLSFGRAVYQFNRRCFLRAILQYRHYDFDPDLYVSGMPEENSGLGSQILFSYKLNPQTVFFLGYSDNYYGDENVDLTRTDRTFFAKLGYAFVM